MSRPSETAIAGLVEILAAEERLYLELRACLQRERAAMEELDSERLFHCVAEKEGLAAEGRVLEESRLVLARRLAEELGLDSQRPRLADICERLGDGFAGLREARARLRALVVAVTELSEANASFAGNALAQVRRTLDLFGTASERDTTYGPPGQDPVASVGRLVHRSA